MYAGDSVHSPLAASLTGYAPQRTTLTLNASNVALYFQSDELGSGPDWSVGYRFSRCPDDCSGHGNCADNVCVRALLGRPSFLRACVLGATSCSVFRRIGCTRPCLTRFLGIGDLRQT